MRRTPDSSHAEPHFDCDQSFAERMSETSVLPLRSALLALCIVLLVSTVVYLPGVNGPMLLDDRSNLMFNPGIRMQELSVEAVSDAATSMQDTFPNNHPWLNRPLSFISFGLNHLLSPTPNAAIKLTNIVIHLANAVLLFVLLYRLMGLLAGTRPHATVIALFGTTIWVLHPALVSTVLYSVQRMTQLSCLFTLLGLLTFVHYRQQWLSDGKGFFVAFVGIALCTVLAYLSKENGVLLLPLCLLLECLFFRWQTADRAPAWQNRTFRLLLWLPTLGILAYLMQSWLSDPHAVPSTRLFSRTERLLTQGPVLVDYLHWFVWPSSDQLTFLHDGRTFSKGLFEPPGTMLAWCLLMTVGLLACTQLRLRPRTETSPPVRAPALFMLACGLLWFYIGHWLESGVLPLELVFEHRNYLPYMGLAMGLATCLALSLPRIMHRVGFNPALLPLLTLTALALPLAAATADRVERWRSDSALLAHWQEHAQDSGRYWTMRAAADVRSQDLFAAFQALARGAELQPWEEGFVLGQLTLLCAEPRLMKATKELDHSLAPKTAASQAQISQGELQSLIARARAQLATPPLSAYAVTQFATLANVCANAPANLHTLMKPLFTTGLQSHKSQVRARAHFFLAEHAWRIKGDLATAQMHWQQALKLEPGNVMAAQRLRTPALAAP